MATLEEMKAERLALREEREALEAVTKKAREVRHDPERVLGTPGNPRTDVTAGVSGPLQRDSRGFRLTKALGAIRGLIPREQAKVELDACEKFEKALTDARSEPAVREPGSILIPLGMNLLTDDVNAHDGGVYMKSMWAAGMQGYDRGEVEWLARTGSDVVRKTAMSYLLDTIGGTLVAPPVQGELIELVRPRECLMAAGATSVPLPPNGRIVFPRQTGPTSFYWVGENTSLTESNPTTGQVAMQAKKGGVFTTLPNELLKYASAAADALIRTDAAKTIALGIDYAGLYGTGSAAQPKGLTLYTGTNEVIDYAGVTPAPKGVATNGNTLRPEDGYRMVGMLEDRNFEFKGWIMRPTTANNINGYRADAAAPEDAAGGFVQGLMRAIGDKMPGTNYCGFPVTKSAVVRANQTKGSGTGLTEVFGGQWEHLMVGMYGAVEMAASNTTGNTFQQDQTAIRALVHVDICPRYEGAFVWYKALLNTMK